MERWSCEQTLKKNAGLTSSEAVCILQGLQEEKARQEEGCHLDSSVGRKVAPIMSAPWEASAGIF